MMWQKNKLEYQEKAYFILAFICLVSGIYVKFWFHYFALSIFIGICATKWEEWCDNESEKWASRGDTIFFPLLIVTNVIYFFICLYIKNATAVWVSGMMLEGLHSAFNSARVWGILQKPNAEREFHFLEILMETIFIEIAPVSLIACLVGIEQMSGWDIAGAVGLIPLVFLLAYDFNHFSDLAKEERKKTNLELVKGPLEEAFTFFANNAKGFVAVLSLLIVVASSPIMAGAGPPPPTHQYMHHERNKQQGFPSTSHGGQ